MEHSAKDTPYALPRFDAASCSMSQGNHAGTAGAASPSHILVSRRATCGLRLSSSRLETGHIQSNSITFQMHKLLLASIDRATKRMWMGSHITSSDVEKCVWSQPGMSSWSGTGRLLWKKNLWGLYIASRRNVSHNPI